jgi:hypothetical protein
LERWAVGREETGDRLLVIGAIVTGVTTVFDPTLPSTMPIVSDRFI